MHCEVWMDLTASSAVNLPITSASLRLDVIWTGVRSIRWTYEGRRLALRLTFTTNLVVFIVFCCFHSRPRNAAQNVIAFPGEMLQWSFERIIAQQPTPLDIGRS